MEENSESGSRPKKQRVIQVGENEVTAVAVLEKADSRFFDKDIRPSNRFPWVQKLLPFFDYVSHTPSVTGAANVQMQCHVCKADSLAKGKSPAGLVSGQHAANFFRHLENSHKKKKEDLLPKMQPKKEDRSLEEVGVTARKKSLDQYSLSNPFQKGFNNYLLAWIVKGGQPFSVVEEDSFKSLIHYLDPRLTVPSRRTIGRQLEQKYSSVKTDTRKEVEGLDPKGLHFVIDMWTSKGHNSVLGVKIFYVKDWKMQQHVAGFKQFDHKHTGVNIICLLKKVIYEATGYELEKVGTVTADNAANIIAAFKTNEAEDSNCLHVEDISRYLEVILEEEDDEELLLNAEESHADFVEIVREFLEDEDDSDAEEPQEQESQSSVPFYRNFCSAHLAQLAINDAIKSSPFVRRHLKSVTEIVNFFHRSPHWYTALRKMGGRGLDKVCITRWNTHYISLDQIFLKDEGVMVHAIQDVLTEAKAANTPKTPKPFNPSEICNYRFIALILQPLCHLTNILQSDGITSSLVIVEVLNCIKELTEMNLEDGVPEVLAFRTSLSRALTKRFFDPSGTSETLRKGRGIVSANTFKSQNHILCTVLDPRIKTALFKDEFKDNLPVDLGQRFPSEDEVFCILKSAMESVKVPPELSSDEVVVVAKPKETSVKTTKAKPSGLELIRKTSATPKKDLRRIEEELSDYLKAPISDCESPLDFWRLNRSRYPRLSTLATLYLPMPATSGSVERLFSIAGAIARSRRARLTVKHLEMALVIYQYLTNKKNA